MSKCLMIKTKDNRKFFTQEKNYSHLIEFSKIFDAEISVVKIDQKTHILDLDELAPAICNPSYKNKTEYELLTTKIDKVKTFAPTERKNRKNIIETASFVKQYITELLLSGKEVSIKELTIQFPYLHMSTLCNHIKNTITKLEINGNKISKLGKGRYIVTP